MSPFYEQCIFTGTRESFYLIFPAHFFGQDFNSLLESLPLLISRPFHEFFLEQLKNCIMLDLSHLAQNFQVAHHLSPLRMPAADCVFHNRACYASSIASVPPEK